LDIKLKNKYIQLAALTLALLLLAVSLLSGLSFWYSKRAITFTNYFDTRDFQSALSRDFENTITLYTHYENFENRSDDDKVNQDELKQMKKNYDADLNEKINNTMEEYSRYLADLAIPTSPDREKIIQERDQKLELVKKQYTKTLEDVRKELVARNTKDYEAVKKSVENNKNVKYYMWDNNNKIYTNIKGVEDVTEYVRDKALFSIFFPSSINSRSDLASINSLFTDKNLKGYVIIPNESAGYSYYQDNYRNYNSLRIRTISLFVLAILLLAAGVYILKLIEKKMPDAFTYIDKFKALCLKFPVDVRFIILFVYTLIILDTRHIEISVFNLPGRAAIKAYFLTIVYILFVYICLPDIKAIFKDTKKLEEYWQQSLTLKLRGKLAEGIKNKGLFYRIMISAAISVSLGAFIIIAALAITDADEGAVLFTIFLYILILFIYLIRKAKHLDKIIKATDEIASGNLNYTLNDKGHSLLSRMARNINNLQEGVKKSVESQLKSDRLKSELITNVSHDLKTPLTSIINYVDLLKRENLSPEEMRDYIGVLDRKTQRLKVLIEDLFEASKMASGSVELNLEKVDTAQLLNQALAEFEEKIQASNLIFKVNIPHSKVYANLDGKKTWRVFENLIGNILKYSQQNTRVYINLYETENKVTITMKNISAYELDFDVEEIYERFKRGDASRHTEGSGLGLAIAKSIVDLQGGALNIEIDGDLFKVTVEFNK
jgi:signal transduction histidine kinase